MENLDIVRIYEEASEMSLVAKKDRAEDLFLDLVDAIRYNLESGSDEQAKCMLYAFFYKVYSLSIDENSIHMLRFINHICFLQMSIDELVVFLEENYDNYYENYTNYHRHYSSVDSRNKLAYLAVLLVESKGTPQPKKEELDYLNQIVFE